MAKIELHPDFKDFLRLLSSHNVRYLLVGGYAVGYHGYPRATGDMDIWIEMSESNSKKITSVFRDFGMPDEAISESLFLESPDLGQGRREVEVECARVLDNGPAQA